MTGGRMLAGRGLPPDNRACRPIPRCRWSSSGSMTSRAYSGFRSKMSEETSPRTRLPPGRPGAGSGKAGRSNSHSLVVEAEAPESRARPRVRADSMRFQPRLDGCSNPAATPTVSKATFSGSRMRSTRLLLSRFGEGDVAEHLVCGARPSSTARNAPPPRFPCRAVSRGTGRQQRAAGVGDFGVEILTDAVEAGLQAAAQAVARGHADFADPAVLQHAEDAAEHEQPADE